MIGAQDIEDAIKCVEFHHFRGTTMVVCCLTLTNGYAVLGEASASDPAKFDLALGQKYAREDAECKVGALLAFVECEKRTTPI